MADILPFSPAKRTVRCLAKQETERLNELYRISAGGTDPLPEIDPEIMEMFRLGIIEVPWRRFE